LKSIDNVIDEDLRNSLFFLKKSLSQDMTLKLLDMNNSHIPNIENKFEKIIDDFTSNNVFF